MRQRDADEGPKGPLLALGRIVKPQGLGGEVRLLPYFASPDHVLGAEKAVWWGRRAEGEALQQFLVERLRLHKGFVLCKFRGVDDADAAEGLRGLEVSIRQEDRPELPEDVFYTEDLVGLAVVDADTERVLGEVLEVQTVGGTDLILVRGAHGEFPIPVARELIVKVDLAARRLRVRLPEGLEQFNQRGAVEEIPPEPV